MCEWYTVNYVVLTVSMPRPLLIDVDFVGSSTSLLPGNVMYSFHSSCPSSLSSFSLFLSFSLSLLLFLHSLYDQEFAFDRGYGVWCNVSAGASTDAEDATRLSNGLGQVARTLPHSADMAFTFQVICHISAAMEVWIWNWRVVDWVVINEVPACAVWV